MAEPVDPAGGARRRRRRRLLEPGLPVDELKIDRSFVSGLAHDAGDVAIVAGCLHMAHAMGRVAVAEGVETQRQRDVLTAMGCDQAQGYLFSRPLPAEALGGGVVAVGGQIGAGAGIPRHEA